MHPAQQCMGAGQQLKALELAAERLDANVLHPDSQKVAEFFSLCVSLSRDIDCAVANKEVPPKVQDLPSLLKKICQRKNNNLLQAAIMVLMFSVKSACENGWFTIEEAQELLALADEIGSGFFSRSINGNLVSTVSTIMGRFYPLLKMGQILASLEVEPGFGAFMTSFHISKNIRYSAQEKIRLFVAQTDETETPGCIISPQQVNFILNGKGVESRTNMFMDTGPQLPTNVSPMLNYGTNLLQSVGQFNGHYIIVVAVMSMASSPNSPALQDYVQPGIAMQDSDFDLIEGPSRISLNCPISYTRIKIPIKGHSCKHLQCFDFSNFVDINSRRPSWRCPHCNQHVCYTAIRVDQNMAKVLREVRENVADIIISADGSWRAILESDVNVDQARDNILNRENEDCEQQESTGIANSNPVVVDLTENDNEMVIVSIGETEDRKPDLQSQPVTANLTMPSELNKTVEVQANQNVVTADDDFWAEILYPDGSASSGAGPDAQTVGGISAPTAANFMVSSVLSQSLNQEMEALGYTHLTTPVMQSLYSAPTNLQVQETHLVNPSVNHEYGRSSVTRRLNQTPIAVQALPVPSMTPHGFSDMEQQQFSIPHVNTFLVPEMASSPLQHHRGLQVVGLQASSALPGAYRVSSGLSTENQNLHQQQQALNLLTPPLMSPYPTMIQSSSPHSRTPTQQASAQVGLGRTASNVRRQLGRFMAGQRVAATAQMTRQPPTLPVEVQTSTGRMRGSLSGRAYSDALSHMVIRPTHPPAQPARLHSSPAHHPSVPPHLQAFLENSSTRLHQLQTNPVTDPGSMNGGTGTQLTSN